jgi:hypothetical protein
MFFNKYQAVFRSRWRALLWAAGVCLTAYCTVPSKDSDNGALLPGLTKPHAAASHAAADPWALDTPAPADAHG